MANLSKDDLIKWLRGPRPRKTKILLKSVPQGKNILKPRQGSTVCKFCW